MQSRFLEELNTKIAIKKFLKRRSLVSSIFKMGKCMVGRCTNQITHNINGYNFCEGHTYDSITGALCHGYQLNTCTRQYITMGDNYGQQMFHCEACK